MKHNKNLEQRTFLQDRFEILIKKQKEGTASFTELTELDDIVNRYAVIRDTILDEMRDANGKPDGMFTEDIQHSPQKAPRGLINYIRDFFRRIFELRAADFKIFLLSYQFKLL